MGIAIITGSSGLIGSASCRFFHEKGFHIVGIDNDMRSYFFGKEASTDKSLQSLQDTLTNYEHFNIDIRNLNDVEAVFQNYNSAIEIIIHTAAQPSHDWAANEPFTDFHVNAVGTLNLLELTRTYCSKAVFIFTSTNKVYGDRPNYSYYYSKPDQHYKDLRIVEMETRYEGFFYNDELASIDESLSIDNSLHSLFGASKLSADILCQEYGKYFGMNTGIFRGGCLTGPNHAGTELHGFLSYLVKCMMSDKAYSIFGFKGKQVRDNINSIDLVSMFWEFYKSPKAGEVYNVGGGRANSISILEAISLINELTNSNWNKFQVMEHNRIGDHVWYISDLTKFQNDYPDWRFTSTLNETITQMINFEINKERV